jgi:hypothetical protein
MVLHSRPVAQHPTERDRPDRKIGWLTLNVAGIIWLTLVVITLGTVLVTTALVVGAPVSARRADFATRWFLWTAGYHVVFVPAALFYRGHLLRGFDVGRPVPHRRYLLGMSAVWLAIALGAWVAMAGGMASRTFLPNVLLALGGTITLLTLWPRGRADGGKPDHAGGHRQSP